MRKLTKREAVLIYLLMMLIICCVGYYYMVLPAKVKRDDAEAELNLAVSEKLMTDTILQMEPTLDTTYKNWKEYYIAYRDIYGPVMETSYIEQKITGYITDCGMELVRSTLTDPAQITLKLPGTSKEGSIYQSMIHMDANGTWDQIMEFIQLCYDEKDIRLTQFKLEDEKDLNLKEPVEFRSYGVSMDMEFYMMPADANLEKAVQR